MSVSPLTRPATSSAKDIEEWEAALRGDTKHERGDVHFKDGKYADNSVKNYDPRLTWILGGLGALTSAVLCAMVNSALTTAHTDRVNEAAQFTTFAADIAVLKARPLGVTQEQFQWEMDKINHRLDADEAAMRHGKNGS